jgi:hypothetical protein
MAPLRDAGRVGFASTVGAVVIAVFTRFFGFGSSARASAFSLSSAPKYSLEDCQFHGDHTDTWVSEPTLFSSDSSLSNSAQRHFGDCP